MSVNSISMVAEFRAVVFVVEVFVVEIEAEEEEDVNDFFFIFRSRASLENACVLSGAADPLEFDNGEVLWLPPRGALAPPRDALASECRGAVCAVCRLASPLGRRPLSRADDGAGLSGLSFSAPPCKPSAGAAAAAPGTSAVCSSFPCAWTFFFAFFFFFFFFGGGIGAAPCGGALISGCVLFPSSVSFPLAFPQRSLVSVLVSRSLFFLRVRV
jgi:hypothetical protein